MRTLLFDIDGTLLRARGGGRVAFERALAEEFSISSPDVSISFAGRTDRGLMEELLIRHGLPPDDHHRGRLRRRYASLLPAELRRTGGDVLPGVPELLRQLASDGRFRIAAMTGNFPETATRKLEHFGLAHYIEWIVGGDLDVDRDAMATRTASLIRRRYEENDFRNVLVIGDTPADVRCGKAIGATTIAVCTGVHGRAELIDADPDRIFEDLSDVATVFAALAGEEPSSQRV